LNWPSKTNYEYSKTTSNTSLRRHIENFHLDQYKILAKENGWKIQLAGLVSQARSQAASEATAVGRPDKFDEQTFHQFLLKFIVVDDQVCLF
jgi:hypothetical protein